MSLLPVGYDVSKGSAGSHCCTCLLNQNCAVISGTGFKRSTVGPFASVNWCHDSPPLLLVPRGLYTRPPKSRREAFALPPSRKHGVQATAPLWPRTCLSAHFSLPASSLLPWWPPESWTNFVYSEVIQKPLAFSCLCDKYS